MPVIQPDTSLAQDMAPLEAGTYPAKIVAAPTQVSKTEKQNLMVVPKFEINVNGKTRTRQSYVVVSGEGSLGFDQLLRACHMDDLADQYRDPSVQPKPPFDTDSLIDQELMVVVDQELYQKKLNDGTVVGQPEIRDRIKSYLKA